MWGFPTIRLFGLRVWGLGPRGVIGLGLRVVAMSYCRLMLADGYCEFACLGFRFKFEASDVCAFGGPTTQDTKQSHSRLWDVILQAV